MNHVEHLAALEREIGTFAEVFDATEPSLEVPSCPTWSVHDLAAHLGVVHRWTECLVQLLAAQRVSSDEMDFDRGPVTASWIRNGGARLVATLKERNPDLPMWAWGVDQHVRFWSRRQLHETLIHRVDLQLASRASIEINPDVAADAIDEFLVNLPRAAAFSPRIQELVGRDRRLSFRQLDGHRRWVMVMSDAGPSLVSDEGPVDVELRAGTVDLLLILYRRRALHDAEVSIHGERELLEYWLERTVLA